MPFLGQRIDLGKHRGVSEMTIVEVVSFGNLQSKVYPLVNSTPCMTISKMSYFFIKRNFIFIFNSLTKV